MVVPIFGATIYIHVYFVARFPYFNGNYILHMFVSINRRNNEALAMHARLDCSLLRLPCARPVVE